MRGKEDKEALDQLKLIIRIWLDNNILATSNQKGGIVEGKTWLNKEQENKDTKVTKLQKQEQSYKHKENKATNIKDNTVRLTEINLVEHTMKEEIKIKLEI